MSAKLREMEEEILDWLSIETEEAARALTEGTRWRYLEPFVAQEASVSAAAHALRVSPNSLLYHVKKFLDLGLLVVTREEKRAGRSVKYYRTKADMLFVPFNLTSAETVEALLLPLEREWQEKFLRYTANAMQGDEADLGVRIWRLPTGEVINKPSLAPPAPFDASLFERWPVFIAWSDSLYLDAEDVKALQGELVQLFERYSKYTGEKKHLIRLGLVPADTGSSI